MRKATSVNLVMAGLSPAASKHLPHLYSLVNEILPQIYKTDGINGAVAARKYLTDQMTVLIEARKPIDDLFEASGISRADDYLILALEGMLAIFDAFLSGVGNAGR